MGHAVNAVYMWSLRQALRGRVIVRIEDHDRQRAKPTYTTAILETLDWLGLSSDNEECQLPNPYQQSVHAAPACDAAFEYLSQQGQMYVCGCSRQQIARQAAARGAEEIRYPGTCRARQLSAESSPARRVQFTDDVVTFTDLVHGFCQQTPSQQCGDILIRDRLGQWTYQFNVVVDDIQQRIDVVIRGDDLLPSTGRQLMLRRMLGASDDVSFLHHPLVFRPDGKKLSKSDGDTGIADLRADGWTAERVLGTAAWLGGLQDSPTPLEAAALATLWH
jgi:glutamyl-Q tRNA(Asp) synthetase